MGHPTERDTTPDQNTHDSGSTDPERAGEPTQALPVLSAPASPLEGLAGDRAPSRLPKVAAWTGLGLVVAGGLYVGAQWYLGDAVPRQTTVAGIDIGGLSTTDAVAALEAGLGPRAAEPIAVTVGEASSTLDPATAGLAFDAEGTLDELTGFSLSPGRLWDHLVGAEDVPPDVDVDPAALETALAGVAESLREEPVDGTVTFVDGAPVATAAEEGTGVDVDAATEAVTDGWLLTDGPIELPTETLPPAVDQAATDAALAEAEQIVSAPVRVAVGGQNPELPERVLAEATSFAPADGALRPRFDGELLTTAIVERTDDLLTAPDEAHFEFRGGRPVIVGGEPGQTLDAEAVAEAVAEAALGTERSTELELVQQDPERSREALEKLGVEEVVSSFATPLTAEPIRTKNLVRGAQLLTGTLVEPGETFSLIDSISPITEANGYFPAGVVSNGVHTEGVGGGLSQMGTTTYNAGYFAGYDDVEHRPHSYWFTRYPPGREATIYVGALDVKFKNDTPYGALMQSWVAGGELHVAIWSTEHYEVRTSDSGKRNVVPTTTVTSTDPDCEYYPAGQAGFSITNYRKVYLDGKLVKDESYAWTYKPDNEVVCQAPGGGG